MDDHLIATIDVGTVSARLLIARVNDEKVEEILRRAEITNLGQGRAISSALNHEAIERTCDVVRSYVEIIKETPGVEGVITTLTSAARDATNIDELIDPLTQMGLAPQVIPGDIEARLSFWGVTQDLDSDTITVVDIGGGSTEIAIGSFEQGEDSEADIPQFSFDSIRSFDIGCRRLTELFERHDPPLEEDLEEARGWIAQEIGSHFYDQERSSLMVAVGGTATSLVAINKALDPYDSREVHLTELSGGDVSDLIDRLSQIPAEKRAFVTGLQEKRAPVIVMGAVILEMVMALGGFSSVVVSESDILVGTTLLAAYACAGKENPVGYEPAISTFA